MMAKIGWDWLKISWNKLGHRQLIRTDEGIIVGGSGQANSPK